jgi:hypothetical protein
LAIPSRTVEKLLEKVENSCFPPLPPPQLAETLTLTRLPSTDGKKTFARMRHAHAIGRTERGSHKDRGKEEGEERERVRGRVSEDSSVEDTRLKTLDESLQLHER